MLIVRYFGDDELLRVRERCGHAGALVYSASTALYFVQNVSPGDRLLCRQGCFIKRIHVSNG